VNHTIRFSMAVLLSASIVGLNACGGISKASSKSSTASTQTGDDCSNLSSTSLELDVTLMGLGQGLDMSAGLVSTNLEQLQTAMAKVKALKLKDANAKAMQTQYLTMVAAAIKPVVPLAQKSNEAGLKAIAGKVKTQLDAASEFRKNKIFFGDCKP
jgi:hypothetical protein